MLLVFVAAQGAVLLLTSSPPVARHVFELAFGRQGKGKQLVSGTILLRRIRIFLHLAHT